MFLAIAGLGGCGADDAEAAPRRLARVGTVAALEARVPDQAVFVGEVRARSVVELEPVVSGKVTRRFFEAGDEVELGQVLYELDLRPFKAAAAEARARVTRARATRDNARREAERSEQLIKSGAISDSQYEQSTTRSAEAEAELRSALAALESSKLDLDEAVVKAPIAGAVDVPGADVGALVRPGSGQPMVRITQLDPIYVYAYISEREVLAYRARRRAAPGAGGEAPELAFRVRLADGSYYPEPGELDYLAPQVDRRTGAYEFRVRVPNPDKLLAPGQYAEVIVGSAEPTARVLVPRKAVVRRQEGSFVLVVNGDDVVEERQVTLGRTVRDLQVVFEGVAAGERVVSSGVQMARAGAQVEVRALPELSYRPEGESDEEVEAPAPPPSEGDGEGSTTSMVDEGGAG